MPSDQMPFSNFEDHKLSNAHSRNMGIERLKNLPGSMTIQLQSAASGQAIGQALQDIAQRSSASIAASQAAYEATRALLEAERLESLARHEQAKAALEALTLTPAPAPLPVRPSSHQNSYQHWLSSHTSPTAPPTCPENMDSSAHAAFWVMRQLEEDWRSTGSQPVAISSTATAATTESPASSSTTQTSAVGFSASKH